MKWYSIRHDDGVAHISIFENLGCFNGGSGDLLREIADARDVQLTIDSIGGDAKVATELYEALRGRTSQAVISGRCGSSAVPVALAAERVVAFADSKFLIHSPALAVLGTAADLRQSANYLDRLSARWIEILSDRTGDIVSVCKWLSADTWLTAEQALEFRLIDEIVQRPAIKLKSAIKSKSATPEVSPVATTLADEGNAELFLDFLRAFGPVRTADRKRFGKELNAWFAMSVQEVSP